MKYAYRNIRQIYMNVGWLVVGGYIVGCIVGWDDGWTVLDISYDILSLKM